MKQSTYKLYATEGHLNTAHTKEHMAVVWTLFSAFDVMVTADEILDN